METSSTSSSSRFYRYDVFLSFRGDDTRKNFVDHLYSALEQRLIRTYKDDITLPRGESVGPALLKAIDESHIALIIFSKNYTDSSWCLDELAYIMKCRDERGKIVMPVFYDVDPSQVRHLKRKFEETFPQQEMKNVAKAEFWRKALVDASNIAGWEPKNVCNGHESAVIKEIADTISDKLSLYSDIDEKLVGMSARLQDLISRLEIGKGGVRMVGIWGVGGSGKTTLATSVYMEIARHFGGHCIVDNIREESSIHGLKTLQEKLLSTVLKTQVGVQSVEQGKCMIKSRLRQSNVLILLDDVNDRTQLEALAGSHKWFGDGSRIIITTRDVHLLKTYKVNHVSPVRLLAHDEAIHLFKRHAYNENQPLTSYETLSLRVVDYSAGLPLALTVLGSFLYDKDEKEWMSTLVRLKDIPETEIVEKLKISYDGLKTVEKELFLDIACFFRGKSKDDALEILDACGFHTGIGIRVLTQKALITVNSNGKFDMHDLVQEMGQYIVRGEHPNNPEKHSRVWKNEEINNICCTDATTENNKIEAMWYDSYGYSSPFYNLVSNMKKLRWLRVNMNYEVNADGPNLLSKELQYIDWDNYPATSPFPDTFQPMKLVVLKLKKSFQKELWNGYKLLPKLKVLQLNCSMKLVNTPNFEGLPCLQKLELYCCIELEEIHTSLGSHRSLKHVEVSLCRKLRMFPTIFQMDKLETLVIGSCHENLELPEIQSKMESLVKLSLDEIGIDILLSSLGERCTNLISLSLVNCFISESIEVNFDGLKHLKDFRFCGISKTKLSISLWLAFHQFTRSLQKLNLCGCHLEDGEIPSDIGEISNLQELNLSYNDFSKLHVSLSQLTRLKLLNLSGCKRLVELPELPSSLAILNADRCYKLKTVGDFYTQCKWLCQVSLVKGCIVKDSNRLLQSMLQGMDIENNTMHLGLQGLEIPKGFTPSLRDGSECSLQLPENWWNDFSGFLMCIVLKDEFASFISTQITMKKVTSGSMGMCSQHDVLWEESASDKATWMVYVSFGSLRHTSWWDETYKEVSFSVNTGSFRLRDGKLFNSWSGFGVSLVPRNCASGPIKTLTHSSSFSDHNDDYKHKFEIVRDSTYALEISPRMYEY